ncbi:VCBS [Fibrisoma limi BUZ 3]|uniref:VCBS n=1 Tax=Fibrisoma limi BUZ 3 TaxID=1185876 RepID=I2GLF2_9BACT|nr:IPT/TIG domain-containing protein [Fibrisoma limi]CCH54728.1 VCBS [Fibrisoma limi BUZ 3]
MNSKTFLYLALSLLTLGAMSCKKGIDPVAPDQTEEPIQGVVRPAGTSLGTVTKKQIGPDGGSLKSADGTLTITVPAGALTALTEVGIEPITGTCPGGIGHGWRLTPHGVIFSKPVQLTIDYTAVKDSVLLPQALGLAYQDSKGIWQFIGATAVNASAHTVTAQTNHFSDWQAISWLTLNPIADQLHEKQQVIIEAERYVYVPTSSDDVFVPIGANYENGYPVGEAHMLPRKYIKDWSLIGPGSLQESFTFPEAVYTAPDQIQKTQTATVALELKGFKNKAILLSNLTLLGNEPTIEYLQVAERDGPKTKESELIIYGANFGTADKTKSTVRINGALVDAEDISVWADNIIICSIPLIGPKSSGPVVVSASGRASQPHILNEWNVEMYWERKQGRLNDDIVEKATVHLRIRGDATTPPTNLQPFLKQNYVNTLSYVNWEAGGMGASSYNNSEGCASEKVTWEKSAGKINLTPQGKVTDDLYFSDKLHHLPGKGFEVQLQFHANDAIPSHHVITPCKGNPIVTKYPHALNFPTSFLNDRFPLLFNGTTLKGGSSRTLKMVPDSRLNWDVNDFFNYTHEVKVVWKDTPARY